MDRQAIDMLEGQALNRAIAEALGYKVAQAEGDLYFGKWSAHGLTASCPLPNWARDLNAAWSLWEEEFPYIEILVDRAEGLHVSLDDLYFVTDPGHSASILSTLLCRLWLTKRAE